MQNRLINLEKSRLVGRSVFVAVLATVVVFGLAVVAAAQDLPEPQPGPQRSIVIPTVKESVLPSGLRIVAVERRANPLVTVKLSFREGAKIEESKAGLADMTMSLFTKGTKTKTATEIASGIEFLGGSLDAGATWTTSDVTLSVPSYNLAKAFSIFADVVNSPVFDQKEIDLYRSQTLDGLNSNLRQPSFLANYVASAYSFAEHPVGGTPKSLESLTREDIVRFREKIVKPEIATLVFVGDVTLAEAERLASGAFGSWKNGGSKEVPDPPYPRGDAPKAMIKRILVVDLPNTGQASVAFAQRIYFGRTQFESSDSKGIAQPRFYVAQVLNAVLGGGYSSRLNQEIRIKRGLSYGANSSFTWRINESNFITRAQTKNESAGEVAELTVAELQRLVQDLVESPEMKARKSVLIGSFGQSLETNAGVAGTLSALYGNHLGYDELNTYVSGIENAAPSAIQNLAAKNLLGGDLIIVGDYSVFGKDVASRFPGIAIKVVKASELDLTQLK